MESDSDYSKTWAISLLSKVCNFSKYPLNLLSFAAE